MELFKTKPKQNFFQSLLKLSEKQVIAKKPNYAFIDVCCTECSYKKSKKTFFVEHQTRLLKEFETQNVLHSQCQKCKANYLVELANNNFIFKKIGKRP